MLGLVAFDGRMAMPEFCRLLTAYPDKVLQAICGERRWLLGMLRVASVATAVAIAYCLFASMASIPDTPGLD